jgi:hypothetical protein
VRRRDERHKRRFLFRQAEKKNKKDGEKYGRATMKHFARGKTKTD